MLKALKRGADRTGISWAAGKLSSGGKWIADHTGISWAARKIASGSKWIADHTGISWLLGKFSSGGKWVAGKFSSGWKWLFSSKTDDYAPLHSEEEEKSAEQRTEPLPLQTPVHGVDNFLEVKDKRLYLNLTKEMLEECKDRKNSKDEVTMLIEHLDVFEERISASETKLQERLNKFRVIGTLDEKNSRIIITDIYDICHDANNGEIKILPYPIMSNINNGKKGDMCISPLPLIIAGEVIFNPMIRTMQIFKVNGHGRYVKQGTILNMVAAAANDTGVIVKVSSEPFVAQATTPGQQPKVNEPVVNQTTTPKQQPVQPNNAPVVDQATTPEQLNAQDPQTHTVMLDVGYFIGEGDNLVLSMTSERYQELKGSTYLYIKRDEVEHRVTVSGNYSYHEDSGRYDVHITSIVEIKGGVLYESENIVEDVKKLLKPGVVAFVESISTKYSGESLHVVQCPPEPQQNGEPEADTMSDLMTGSNDSFFSATSGASDASETLSLTDAQSTRDSDSDTTITNASLSTMTRPSARKDFFDAYSSINPCKVIAIIPEAPYGPAEMQKPLKQQVEAMRNGEAELHVSPELSKALHYLHKESLEGDKLLHKTVQNSLSKISEKPDSLINQTTTKKEVVAGEKSL